MKLNKLFLLVLAASFLVGAGLFIGCGSDDDDDDETTTDDDGESTCEEAMTFLFEPETGCFELSDGEGNTITPEDLCGGDYADQVECYKGCYDENNDCQTMGDCLSDTCGIDFGN